MRASDLMLIARTRTDLASGTAREEREAANVTQAEMAAALGVTPAAVSHWERGSRTPNGDLALAYGRLLARLGKMAA